MRWNEKLTKEEITLYRRAVDDVKSIETHLYATIKFCADMKMAPERIKTLSEILATIQSVYGSMESDVRNAEERR
jgi:hypothetical protein